MPRGRKNDYDRRIRDLVGQLKVALIAREQQRIEQQVEAQVAGIVRGLNGSYSVSAYARLARASGAAKPAAKGGTARAPRKAAGTKIASAVKAAWARLTPAERKARIEKMHAWRKRKKG
jgi:hypothetical protein